ncbi:MAG: aspartate aminotransferase family protein [Halobacteriovoraceae bacterium]|nr:aspartate aminotransferase family protein [Halobacteriovoraceae bacterium]
MVNETLHNRSEYVFSNLATYFEEPIELVSGEGSFVFDAYNKKYLDFIGGIVTISIGHNHPRITSKLKELLEKKQIQHTSTLFLSSYVGEAAKKLINLSGARDYEVYFSNSGSEANEIACLAAREFTKSQTIISLRHSYHGGTNATLSLCGHSSWRFHHQPTSSVLHSEAPYCYRCPYDKRPESCDTPCADDLDKIIQTCSSGNVAGIIVEPVMGVGGFIDGPKKYFQKIYEIIKDNGGLFISDEVQTGVGRLGKNFFGAEDFGIKPDIYTMAKSLGNGVPVGATIAKKEIVKSLHGKTHFSTFGGDPFQMAQVHEVLSEIEESNLIQNAYEKGELIKSFLLEAKKDFSFIGDVRGRGLLIGVEVVSYETGDPDPKKTQEIMELCKRNRLLIGKGGLKGNVLRIAPPLNISIDEVELFKQKMSEALKNANMTC